MALGSSRFRGGAQGKFHKISFRTVCRVILHHPFLLVTLLYLIILHRYFPFLFSILVSSSPVIICTALLLGTLLLHGQQQDPKFGNREERSNVTESLNNGAVDVVDDTFSVDNGGIFSKERFGGIRNDIVENVVTVSRGFQFSGFDLKDIQSLELHAPKHDQTYGKNINERRQKSSLDIMVAEAIPNPQETRPLLESEDPRHPQISHDPDLKSEVESLESIPSSEDSEEDDEKGDNVDDDETPKAIDGDSPSPFAWTENDQRILQELRSSEIEKNEHLESLISRADDDESEDNEEESVDDVDDDIDADIDDDEEEDGNVDVEKVGGKHVTLWTEEDEKNLRHLGCSELERNLRLENLLARRRAKRNFSMISERNLIDLDKIVLPSPVPPISTARVNPFDKPDDTSHHPSGPPIPGSAPSVTLPRKNPFDSPCTSPKKTRNLGIESIKESSMEMNINNASFHENGSSSKGYNTMGNASKPPFVDKNRKEALFRRYESFSAGFNMMEDGSKDDIMEFDRKDFVFRRHGTFNTRLPFPSYFNPNKPVFVAEHVAEEVWHPSLDRQLSQDNESVESETSSYTETSTAPIDHQDEEAHNSDHTSSHIETGSESSESLDSHYDDHDEHIDGTMEVNVDRVQQEQEVLHVGHDNHDDTSSSSSSEHDVTSSVNDQDEHFDGRIEVKVDHVHQEQEIYHEGHNNHDATSSSSLSSEHDVKSYVNESQLLEHEKAEVSAFSSKDSLSMSEASHMSMDEDHHPVEPVYDTSPSGVEKVTAFSHITQE